MPKAETNARTDRCITPLARVLVPIDFTGGSEIALTVAASLSATGNQSLLMLHVVDVHALARDPDRPGPNRDALAAILTDCRAHLREFRARLVPADTRTQCFVRTGRPEVEILRLAVAERSSLIVLSAVPPDCSDGPFGSTALAVARQAPCPVLIVREDLPVG